MIYNVFTIRYIPWECSYKRHTESFTTWKMCVNGQTMWQNVKDKRMHHFPSHHATFCTGLQSHFCLDDIHEACKQILNKGVTSPVWGSQKEAISSQKPSPQVACDNLSQLFHRNAFLREKNNTSICMILLHFVHSKKCIILSWRQRGDALDGCFIYSWLFRAQAGSRSDSFY